MLCCELSIAQLDVEIKKRQAQYERERAVVAPKKLGTRKATLVALAAPARAAHF